MTDMNQKRVRQIETASFAGGCFWCIESAFAHVHGVVKVVSGYMGRKEANPFYENISNDMVDHREAVQLEFDVKKVSYERLVKIFWIQIDPTDAGGQFADRGHQYTTAIYYHNYEQKLIAEKSKADLEQSKRFIQPIVTEILPAQEFWKAENYHQEYYKKYPTRYNLYHTGSGREAFTRSKWKGF